MSDDGRRGPERTRLVLCGALMPPCQGAGGLAPGMLSTRVLAAHVLASAPPGSVHVDVLDFASDVDPDAAAQLLLSYQPDLVGFSTYQWNERQNYRIADQLKLLAPRVLNIFGGPQIEYDDEDTERLLAAHCGVDILVHGEGEQALTELIALHQTGCGPPRGTVVVSRPLNRLADPGAPLFEMFPPAQRIVALPLDDARGCASRCGFCRIAGRGHPRTRPAEFLRRELRWALANGARNLTYSCSAVNFDDEHLHQTVACIKAEDPRGVMTHRIELDFRRLTQHQAECLGSINVLAGLGLQSTHPEVNRLMHRRFERDCFESAVRLLNQYSAAPQIEIILGLPGDTQQSFAQTLEFALSLDGSVDVFVFHLLPGTEFYRRRRELGLRSDPQRNNRIVETPTMSEQDLLACMDLVRERAAQLADGGRGRVGLFDPIEGLRAGDGRFSSKSVVVPASTADGIDAVLDELRKCLPKLEGAVLPWRAADLTRVDRYAALDMRHEHRRLLLAFCPTGSSERYLLRGSRFDISYLPDSNVNPATDAQSARVLRQVVRAVDPEALRRQAAAQLLRRSSRSRESV